MNAGTQGRAEYETWRAAVPDRVCNVPAGPWGELSPGIRAGFAAIAARAVPDPDGQQRYIGQLHDLIRDMCGAYPGLAAELPAFQDRAGQLYVHDHDGQPISGSWADGDGPRPAPAGPEPAPEQAAAVLAEVLDFLGDGIPPGDEFALQVAAWRKRGLPS